MFIKTSSFVLERNSHHLEWLSITNMEIKGVSLPIVVSVPY